MNSYERIYNILVEAHGPLRHGRETREREFHKAMQQQDKGREDFEKSGGPKSKPYTWNSPEKEEEFHTNLIKKGEEATVRRHHRLTKQFELKKKAKKTPTNQLPKLMKWIEKRAKRRDAKKARTGEEQDEVEYTQDHLDRPY